MAKTFDKTKIKEQIAKQVEQEQIEDLNHLQEKKNFSREKKMSRKAAHSHGRRRRKLGSKKRRARRMRSK